MLNFNRENVLSEYPLDPDGHIYFNSGCCGRKPKSVIEAVKRGYDQLNTNPCHFTFNDTTVSDQARQAVARLLGAQSENILLAFSTTNALQILMQSFLLQAGDELITTDQEHGSLRTVARYLEESRGIVVKTFKIAPPSSTAGQDSYQLMRGILELVGPKTRLVALSALVSYTGWRPDLTELARQLDDSSIPLLADCAHGPGQILCRPQQFPLWVGSGHKWLGAPNGTAFAYVRSDLAHLLQPVNLGDVYYARHDADSSDLSRLEGTGTFDPTKWRGLVRAIDLHLSYGVQNVTSYQLALAKYLRRQLQARLSPQFRTADLFDTAEHECSSMLNFRFESDRLKVPNLQDYMWQEHKIAVQLDYLNQQPGLGMRISCHISNSSDEIDKLLNALEKVVIK